jgi:acyl carrier protein
MDELFEEMKKFIAEYLDIDERKVTMGASFQKDLGADDDDTYILIPVLIAAFSGIKIPDEKVNKLITVKDAYEFIKSKGANSPQDPEELMEAVDFYNRGCKNMDNNKFSEAEKDFTCVIQGRGPRGKHLFVPHDIEMMAYLNRGIAFYNQAIGKNIFSNETHRYISEARLDWEKVLKEDTDNDRKKQAMEFLKKLQQAKDSLF